jgi:replicative DNA helicase
VNGSVPNAPEPVGSPAEVLLELNGRRLVSGASVLDAAECVESIWGDGHQSLWARGEPFLLVGPDGVGKTTLAQQGSLGLGGIGEPRLLGFSLHADERRVLYVAADRPAQALRSMRRMVSEQDRQALDERLALWKGPLPFDLAKEPDGLLTLVRKAGCGYVVLDSLKDVAADLSKEETGLGLNRAFQLCCANDVDVMGIHHQRKAQPNEGKPRRLADVYGSRWLTAGAGSVLMLWGEAGDPVVELTHLKQPDETVGPFQILHDHTQGRTTVVDHLDAFTVVNRATKGITAADVASALFGDREKNSTEKARRQLQRLVSEHKVHYREGNARGGAGGRDPARYFPVTLLTPGGAGDAL